MTQTPSTPPSSTPKKSPTTDHLILDIETDNLLHGVTKVHCVGLMKVGGDEAFGFGGTDAPLYPAYRLIAKASTLIGHNILHFDLPVLRKVASCENPSATVIDTLLLSRLFYPDLLSTDFAKKPQLMPLQLYGRHSLEAWGYRLGCYKGQFGKTTDWSEFSTEMLDYCLQDVQVTARLWRLFQRKLNLPDHDFTLPDWITLETRSAQILAEQEEIGWSFDERSAVALESDLRKELEAVSQVLRDRHPVVAGTEFTPRRKNRTKMYHQGATFTKLVDLKPTSRDHIAWIFKTHYGWKPTDFTEKGKPVIDEVVLTNIGTPIALDFLKALNLTKALGALSEGPQAYLKVVRDGRIHHHCSVATQTHRCAHRHPNLGQVPSDLRFRALFRASEGRVMVGADLQAIELRMLAHYLGRYDGGEYARILLMDDIHQVNADRIGITRKQVKTVTYAFLYGAGDVKLGHSLDPNLPEARAKSAGQGVRQAYMDAIPGLQKLVTGVKKVAKENGQITGIDGRPIKVEAPHKALNYLLQGGAGVIAKKWMVLADNQLSLEKAHFAAHQLAFVHDELQFEADPDYAEHLKEMLTLSAQRAGEAYKLRIPIAAEARIGETWADVH